MEENKVKFRRNVLFFAFLSLTLVTTTIAGAEWMTGKALMYYSPTLTFTEVLNGLNYSIPFLGILTFHEFGHYLTARYYQVKVTLPTYVPFWLGFLGFPLSIGTFGAFIRILEPVRSRKEYFDIGVAGPLAGFIVSLFVLYYGFTHLPDPKHIFSIHPEYVQYGPNYADSVYKEEGLFKLGDNLVFLFFKKYVAPDPALVPNPYEIYHYPFLFAGFLALFFTALNLLPMGQLDGGHVLYGLFGARNHERISVSLFLVLLFFAGIGIVSPYQPVKELIFSVPLYAGFLYISLYSLKVETISRIMIAVGILASQFILVTIIPGARGYEGWLLIALLIGRFLGVYHPPVHDDRPLSPDRKIIGWITLIIFIISFSPRPFVYN
ncbi:MAG TPA: site-2 protease family protein [Cyclobacteriaceae bacterium]|nr:site-2 protease family protein [Cyclobacteriaceae bacterium]